MFEFKSFMDLIGMGADFVYFDQCMHGALSRKPTTILFRGNGKFSSLAARCDHPKVQTNKDGFTFQAPHPSFVGKRRPDGKYLTGDLAAYSGKFNCRLATLINAAAISSSTSS